MTKTVHIENVVLGGGEAGKTSVGPGPAGSRRGVIASQSACPNIACLPGKNVIQSVKRR